MFSPNVVAIKYYLPCGSPCQVIICISKCLQSSTFAQVFRVYRLLRNSQLRERPEPEMSGKAPNVQLYIQ